MFPTLSNQTVMALVLKWLTSWTTMCEPSVPFSRNVLVPCWTSFLLLDDSPNHSALGHFTER
jgi:hypothetical protein